MKRKILTKPFFARKTLIVAKELLGKYLVRHYRGKEIVSMLTEVEAYDGFLDKASHAHRGKTNRNQIMFGEAGCFYIYFTYGIHWLVNIVTDKKDYPAAVLLRGVEAVNGPARLTKYFKIDKQFNGKDATPETGLWFEDRGVKISSSKIKCLPRIGVDYAGEIWAMNPYRFILSLPKTKNQPTPSRSNPHPQHLSLSRISLLV